MNPIFLNPHANAIQVFHQTQDIFKELWLSRNSCNKAVEMLIKNPRLVNANGIVSNNNPKIGSLLEKSMHQFEISHWHKLAESHNPAVMAFLEKHPKKINWSYLSANECPEAIRILEKNPDKIVWWILSSNPSAIDILCNNQDKIDWWSFCKNTNPRAISIIEQNLDEINIEALSANPDAIHIISQHLDKVSPHYLSKNPKAMDILMEHPELIEFDSLLVNPAAISYLETQLERFNIYDLIRLLENPNCVPLFEIMVSIGMLNANIIPEDIIDELSHRLCHNKSLYDLDYQAMSKIRSKIICNELEQKAFHPDNVEEWSKYFCANGGDIADFDWVS
jgi:hypothetical protein